MFGETFDSLFTKRHFSWACFWRSSVASIFSVALILLVTYAFGMKNKLHEDILEGSFVRTSLALLLIPLVFNVIPDYISLLETRIIIKWMGKKRTSFKILLLLIIDLVATNIIFFVFTVWMVIPAISLAIGSNGISIESFLSMYIKGLTWSSNGDVLGIFIYSTFFTSIWVWMYALSGFIVGILNKSKPVLAFFKNHLALENRPLRSMASVTALITTFIYLFYGLFVL